MLWDLDRAQVFWEFHDGVIDEVPRESLERLWLCLQRRDPKRQFVYVKPNLSATGSAAVIEFARQHGVLLLTCPKWSYYDDVMIHCNLFRDRERLRRARNTKDPRQILFMGGIGSYTFDKSVYRQLPYSYGISGQDARLFKLEGAPNHEPLVIDRQNTLSIAQTKWGSRFSALTSLHPYNYIQHLIGQRDPMPAFCFQPHGVALRHAIYESMALGIPSIIAECSYLDDITRRCNIIYDGDLPDLPDRRPDLEQACVEAFETYMTPKAIVDNVLNQLRNHRLL